MAARLTAPPDRRRIASLAPEGRAGFRPRGGRTRICCRASWERWRLTPARAASPRATPARADASRGRSGAERRLPREQSERGLALLRQRIRPQLEMCGERLVALAAFNQPRRPIAVRGPQASPLPARLRIVDAAVEALRVEADRIRHAQDDHAAVGVGDDAVVEIAGRHRHVVTEAERVVLIDP